MSGSPMLDLVETRDGTLPLRLPEGRDPVTWHAALTAEIAALLSPAHAALLAEPVRTETGLAWRAAGEDQHAFADLAVADRRALTTTIGAILSDIRRLGESGRAPNVAAAWPALREVPDWKYVFAVDGCPVLAAWGHGGAEGSAGLLARLDDGVPWRPPARLPWSVYAASLAAVALLALAVGLLLPAFGGLLPGPPACMAAPGQLDLLAAQNHTADRGNELRQLLAVLDDEIGRRQLQCPIRNAARPAVPPPRADLPQENWNRHDLTMLEGCWRNITNLVTQDSRTHQIQQVDQWRLCFDRSGSGHQTITWTDGITCQGPMRATFSNDSHLVLTDTARCSAASRRFLYVGRFECERISDSEATCIRTDTEGPGAGNRQGGRFMR
jgi:hypothetical protein